MNIITTLEVILTAIDNTVLEDAGRELGGRA